LILGVELSTIAAFTEVLLQPCVLLMPRCALMAGPCNAAEGSDEGIRGDAAASMTGSCNCPCHIRDPHSLGVVAVVACGSDPSRRDGTDGEAQPDAPVRGDGSDPSGRDGSDGETQPGAPVRGDGSGPSRRDGSTGEAQPDAPVRGENGGDAAVGGDTQPVAAGTAMQGVLGCATLGGLVLRLFTIASPAIQDHDTPGDSVRTEVEPLHVCCCGPTAPLGWPGC